MSITFPEGAKDYYDVMRAAELLAKPAPDGYIWWRCLLCGYPQGCFKIGVEVGNYCCGGCGHCGCRPISEYGDE